MADLISIASKEVGYKESDKNRTKYGKWYGLNGYAWCHMFVAWCAYKAGVLGKYVPREAGCSNGWKWYCDHNMEASVVSNPNYKPKRNDIIYFLNGASHVGIVEYFDNKTGLVHTIEGNAGKKCDGVYRCVHHWKFDTSIKGYGLASKAFKNGKSPKATKPTSTSTKKSATPAVTSTPSTSKKASSSDNKKSNVANTTTKEELEYLRKILAKNEKAKKTPATQSVTATVTGRETSKNLKVTLIVNHNSKFYQLPVKEGATVTWERKGTPGKLNFTTMLNKTLLSLGDSVALIVNKKHFFYGFVFTIKPKSDGTVDVTAYDQLRYFKNKDTYMYKKKTATKLLQMIAKDYGLKVYSKLPNTKYAATRIDDDMTLFDIFENNLDETMWSTGKVYILYDDYGKLRLRQPWKVNILIDEETGQSYDYTDTIDSDVYNQVKLAYDNDKAGSQEYFISKNSKAINKWGLLQYFEKIDSPKLGKLKGKVLLQAYCKSARTLSVTECFGDVKVRAGCMLPVMMKLYDKKIANYMLVDKVTHKFNNASHTMDLALSGGDFDTTEQ